MAGFTELKIEDVRECKVAVDLVWSFQLEEADQKLCARAADHPLFALYYGENAFCKAVITEDKEDAKTAFTRLVAAHQMAKALLRKATTIPEKIILNFILADSDLYDAALKFKLKSEMKGAIKFRKAWKYFEAAMPLLDKMDQNSPLFPHLHSAIMSGAGFFHFIISIVPQEWQWVIQLVGFKGDRDKGLEELLMASADDGLGTPTSLLHLTWIYAFFFEEFELADKYLRQMLSSYPTSALGHYLGGYLYRKHGRPDESDVAFANAQVFSAELKQLQGMALYELGYNRFLLQDWHAAIESMQPLLEGKFGYTPPDGYKVFGTFQIAVCQWMLGEKEKATEAMKAFAPWVRKNYDYDAYAERKSKKFLEKGGFSKFDEQIMVVQSQMEAKNYDGCLATLESMSPSGSDEIAQQTAMKGACLFKKKRYDEAKAALVAVLQMKVKADDASWVHPFACVTQAEVLVEVDKDYKGAQKALTKALGYSGYDFCQLLGWKCKKMQDEVKRMEKGK